MKKIMIVEDSMLMISVITSLLAKEDIKIITATSGRQAISSFRKERPDLVFMDVMMPDMDGIETVEKIKQIDTGAKIVMCTALSDPVHEERARKAGCLGYITKPFTKKQLISAIKEFA